MSSKWVEIPIKQYLVFLVIFLIITRVLAEIAFYALSKNDVLLMLSLLTIFMCMGVGFVYTGFRGILTGKTEGIDPLGRFNLDFSVNNGYVGMKEREFSGFFGYARSLVALCLGIGLLFMVCFMVAAI